MKAGREIFIFIGPPGAGKGTLSQLCINRMGWMQCSTGDLCRQHVAKQTELGHQIDLLIKSGKLISDSLIVEMVEEWLTQYASAVSKVILDGFPRTTVQAQLLDRLLRKPEFSDFSISIIKMELANDQVVKRLVARLVCANRTCCAVYSAEDSVFLKNICANCASPLIRRSDDIESVIQDRLATYRIHADTLVRYYAQAGKRVQEIDVVQPVEKVFDQFVRLVDIKTA